MGFLSAFFEGFTQNNQKSPGAPVAPEVDLFFIFKTIGDPPLGKIVGRQLNLDPVTG